MAWRSKLSQSLQELRIHMCQTSVASKVTRDFVVNNYKSLKTLNPRLPILVRECSGIQPRLWARYDYEESQMMGMGADYGVERSIPLDGLSEAEINAKLEELVATAPQKQN